MRKSNAFYLISAVLCCLVFLSCKKNKEEYSWNQKDTFSFREKVSSIDIRASTNHFELIGITKEPPKFELIEMITIVPEKTTAITSMHYTLPEPLKFVFPAKSTEPQSLRIALFPENITEPLDIAFTSQVKKFDKDYSMYNDTIIIHLTPVL